MGVVASFLNATMDSQMDTSEGSRKVTPPDHVLVCTRPASCRPSNPRHLASETWQVLTVPGPNGPSHSPPDRQPHSRICTPPLCSQAAGKRRWKQRGSDFTQPIAPPAWSTQPAGFSASSALRWRPARQPSSTSYSPCPPTVVRSAFKPVQDVAIYELSARIAGVLLGVISGWGQSVHGRSRSLAGLPR